jgi:hypothetical protein
MATAIFGSVAGYGFISKTLAGGDIFVMPGPYQRSDRVAPDLGELGEWWRGGRASGSITGSRRRCRLKRRSRPFGRLLVRSANSSDNNRVEAAGIEPASADAPE